MTPMPKPTAAVTRDQETGRYAHSGDWDRVCKCGHRLGSHTAAVFRGLRDCLIVYGFGRRCHCQRFRPTGKRRAKEHFATAAELGCATCSLLAADAAAGEGT